MAKTGSLVDGRLSPPLLRLNSQNLKDDVYQPWDMTDHERELALKCVRLIRGKILSKVTAEYKYRRTYKISALKLHSQLLLDFKIALLIDYRP